MTCVAAATFEDAIETERARLMTEALLHCIVIAMDESDDDDTCAPHYQTVIDLARELVTQSIDQLDSVRVGPTLDKNSVRRAYGVKEIAAEDVH